MRSMQLLPPLLYEYPWQATQIGDIAGTRVRKMVLGQRTSAIPATTIQSMTGHMLVGSWATEAALTLMTMREGVISPTTTMNGKTLLRYQYRDCKEDAAIRVALANSFGFGGVNAVLAFKRSEQ